MARAIIPTSMSTVTTGITIIATTMPAANRNTPTAPTILCTSRILIITCITWVERAYASSGMTSVCAGTPVTSISPGRSSTSTSVRTPMPSSGR